MRYKILKINKIEYYANVMTEVFYTREIERREKKKSHYKCPKRQCRRKTLLLFKYL